MAGPELRGLGPVHERILGGPCCLANVLPWLILACRNQWNEVSAYSYFTLAK
jgi:hypothetical protein